jgi:hypothetical protein
VFKEFIANRGGTWDTLGSTLRNLFIVFHVLTYKVHNIKFSI